MPSARPRYELPPTTVKTVVTRASGLAGVRLSRGDGSITGDPAVGGAKTLSTGS
jgi:hypothetical protein